MKYLFKCPECGEQQEVEMSISEYARYEAVCENCGEKMERVYEMPEVGGKSKTSTEPPPENHTHTSSCGGSCSSCSSCGL